MRSPLADLLIRHQVLVPADNAFQRRARLLQALWREEQGLPIGEHRGRPLGSRLAMPAAKDDLSNYLTEAIRDVVRCEVLDPQQSKGKLYGQPRIFNDLLSSQPLCFNLFGELQQDLELASRVFQRMTAGRVNTVTAIGFEVSPGRGDAKYIGDSSAFDVFVEYVSAGGVKGFCAIEVKYHESLADKVATHKARYDAIANAMDCFEPTASERLKAKPLQQIWRDHLLMGSLLRDEEQGFKDGFFAFLYPQDNACCADAVAGYRSGLRDATSFASWTLESFVEAITKEGGGAWIEALKRRYSDFGKVDAVLEAEVLVTNATG